MRRFLFASVMVFSMMSFADGIPTAGEHTAPESQGVGSGKIIYEALVWLPKHMKDRIVYSGTSLEYQDIEDGGEVYRLNWQIETAGLADSYSSDETFAVKMIITADNSEETADAIMLSYFKISAWKVFNAFTPGLDLEWFEYEVSKNLGMGKNIESSQILNLVSGHFHDSDVLGNGGWDIGSMNIKVIGGVNFSLGTVLSGAPTGNKSALTLEGSLGLRGTYGGAALSAEYFKSRKEIGSTEIASEGVAASLTHDRSPLTLSLVGQKQEFDGGMEITSGTINMRYDFLPKKGDGGGISSVPDKK